MNSDGAVIRFAPSPNGYLHLGHAYSALFAFDMARRVGGRFLLRIEDIDVGRCKPEFTQAILEDLAWLGLEWEEPVLFQSAHFADFEVAASRLDAMGLLYPCFATRREIEQAAGSSELARDPDGAVLYPGLYRAAPRQEIAARMEAGEPHAMRLNMARALEQARSILKGTPLTFRELGDEVSHGPSGGREVVAKPERWGDVVIQRKDVPTSYHLAVVVDDARQGVTQVTRGLDLYAATDVHRLLQVLLGLECPIYRHHKLISDEVGHKLSKSRGDVSLRAMRADGLRRSDILEVFRRSAQV